MAKRFDVFLCVTIKVNTPVAVNADSADEAKRIAKATAVERLRSEYRGLINAAYRVEPSVVAIDSQR